MFLAFAFVVLWMLRNYVRSRWLARQLLAATGQLPEEKAAMAAREAARIDPQTEAILAETRTLWAEREWRTVEEGDTGQRRR